MSGVWKWSLVGLAVVVIACVIVVLWPAGDPLAGVQSVAVTPPDWGASPRDAAVQGPFLRELEVVLGGKNVRIVADPAQADAVLVVKRVNLGRIELRIDSGGISGTATARCELTDQRTGRGYLMDFTLTMRNGEIRARLTPKRFWQVWK